MKKLSVLLIIMFISQNIKAQGTINISITQDVKLATIGDDKGNQPFTPDVRFDLFLNGGMDEKATNYGFIGLTYEYANLYGGDFNRWGLIGGWSFKSGIFNIKTKVEPYAGLSVINRKLTNNKGNMSFETGFNFAFEVNDFLEIIAKTNLMQRGDLDRFKDEAASYNILKWQPQFGMGCRFKIF